MLNSRGHGSLRWYPPFKHSAAPTALFIAGIDNPALPGWADFGFRPSPDFLWTLAASVKFMRLSSWKGADAVLSSAARQEIRVQAFTKHIKNQRSTTMSSVLDEVLEANRRYSASFGEKGKLALPPARRFAILTCMDARIDPAKLAGLAEGDAHVIRNAGGRASDDAVRSLVISYKLLGTREFFVIHHTNCGMEFFTNDVIRGLLDSSLETADLTPSGFRDVGKGPGSRAGEFIEWLTIADPVQAVIDDVNRLRNHPLIPRSIPIYGYVYNVTTGELVEVEGAKKPGAAA
jgi:carbonic anhydrase